MTEQQARDKYIEQFFSKEYQLNAKNAWDLCLEKSPTVLGLVSMVEMGIELANSDFCCHQGRESCSWCEPFIQALSAYRAEVGKE